MRYLFISIVTFTFSSAVFGQKNIERTLKQLNSETVPYAYVNELDSDENKVVLDTRQQIEYNVSHIKGALWVGYDNFQEAIVLNHVPNKDTPILVYCSIGVRSEDIGEKLQKAGYTNVKNLYGGIFEWKNQENPVYNNKLVETDSVHTFDKHWGKLLKKGIKIY